MSTPIDSLLENNKVEKSCGMVRALTNPMRLRILSYISNHDQTTVNAIYKNLRFPQSITSQQLNILRRAGLVVAKRSGRFILYSLSLETIETVTNAINTFLGS